jgi:NAD(P)-dependent dehydrogenase (short-subunit alcohol dehydrogenase family)
VIASILARIGVAGYTGYSASKTGLLGLVRSLAAELAAQNVQVNAICPGWVRTDMAREGLELIARELGTGLDEAEELALRSVPLGRMGEPEDVAGTVAYLLSPAARGVTGQALDQNGGAWMG